MQNFQKLDMRTRFSRVFPKVRETRTGFFQKSETYKNRFFFIKLKNRNRIFCDTRKSITCQWEFQKLGTNQQVLSTFEST